jgi:hypothetical protein
MVIFQNKTGAAFTGCHTKPKHSNIPEETNAVREF